MNELLPPKAPGPPFFGLRRDRLTKQHPNLSGFATASGFREKELESIESLTQWIIASFKAESAKRYNQNRYVQISYARTGDRKADLRVILNNSILLARTMEAAAGSSDTIELSNGARELFKRLELEERLVSLDAAFELKEKLEDLWGFRGDREEIDWGDLLNTLQCCIFADVKFEQFSVQKCAAVRMVLELLRGPIGIEQLDLGFEYLSDAGFDPWASISPQNPDEN